jgi:glycosyltransferase involved in cell wall biosynthesis
MRIAITGTRGIPNRHGGFEQFAERLSVGLAERGHEVWVYNPVWHPFKGKDHREVRILRKRLPEKSIGPGGNYLYDLSCLKDALGRGCDLVLECGYASASPWYPLLKRKNTRLVTHMDGMEWQREKWGWLTRKLFQKAEKTAVKHSDLIVCDHPEIARYYRESYSSIPTMIPYGADITETWDNNIPSNYDLETGNYYLIIARLEPENNIRPGIEGFLASGVPGPLVIVGDHSGKYGRMIFRKFRNSDKVRFMGGIYDPVILDHLRHFSKAVIHGHSAGGTNPSLLEAMAAGAYVIAHDNPYNRWVLGDNASYFSSAGDASALLSGRIPPEEDREKMISLNYERIRTCFRWDSVISQYEILFDELVEGEHLYKSAP